MATTNITDLDFFSLSPVLDLCLDFNLETTNTTRSSVTLSSIFTTTSDGLLAPPDYYTSSACSSLPSNSDANSDLELLSDQTSDIDFCFSWLPLYYPQRKRPSPPSNRRPRSLPLQPIAGSIWHYKTIASSSASLIATKYTADYVSVDMSQPTGSSGADAPRRLFDDESIMAMLEGLSGDVNLDGFLSLDSSKNNNNNNTNSARTGLSTNSGQSTIGTLSNSLNPKQQQLFTTPVTPVVQTEQRRRPSTTSQTRDGRVLSTALVFQGDPMDEEDLRRCNSRRRAHLQKRNLDHQAIIDDEPNQPIDANFFAEFPDEVDEEATENTEHQKLQDLRSILMQTIGGQPGVGDSSGPTLPFPGESISTARSVPVNPVQQKRTRSAMANPPPAAVADNLTASLARAASVDTSNKQMQKDNYSDSVNYYDTTLDQQQDLDYARTDDETDNLRAMIAALEAAGQDPEKIARQVHIFQIIQGNMAHSTQPPLRRLNAKEILRQGISAPRYIIGSAQVEVQSLRRPLIDPNALPSEDPSATGRLDPVHEDPDAANGVRNGNDSLRRQFKTIGKKIKNTVGKKTNNDGRLMPHLSLEQHQEYIMRQQQLHEQLVNQMKQAALVINGVLGESATNNNGSRMAVGASSANTDFMQQRSLAPIGVPQSMPLSDASSQRSGRSANSGNSNSDNRYTEMAMNADNIPLIGQDDANDDENILLQQQQHLLMQQQQLQQQHQYLQQQLFLLQQRQEEAQVEEDQNESSSQLTVNQVKPRNQLPTHTRNTSTSRMRSEFINDSQRASATSISALLPPDPATMMVGHQKTAANFYSNGSGAASSVDSLVAQINAALEPAQLNTKRTTTANGSNVAVSSTLRGEIRTDTASPRPIANDAPTVVVSSTTSNSAEAIPPPPGHRPPPAPPETNKSSTAAAKSPILSHSTITTTVAGSYQTSTSPSASSKAVSQNELLSTSPVQTASPNTSPMASKSAYRQSQRFSRLMMPQTPIVEAVWSTAPSETATATSSNTNAGRVVDNTAQNKLQPLTEENGDRQINAATTNQPQEEQSPPDDFLLVGEQEESVKTKGSTDSSNNKQTSESAITTPTLSAQNLSCKNSPQKEKATPVVESTKCNSEQQSLDDDNTTESSQQAEAVKSVKAATLEVTNDNNLLQLLPALQTISPFTLSSEGQSTSLSGTKSNNANNGLPLLAQSLPSPDYDNTIDFSDEYDENEDEEDNDDNNSNQSGAEDANDDDESTRRGRSAKQASRPRRSQEYRRTNRLSGLSRSRSRSRSRTRAGRHNMGRHRNKRESSGIFSAVRLRKRDSAMSVWSIDVPDQTPLPAAPPPGVPPVPRLTTELVSMPTVTPANEPTLTPMSSSRAPTTTPVHSANNKLATSSTASTLPELNLDHDNPSTEWVPQPTFAAAVANAMASLTADEAATLAQASAIATNSKGNASQPAPNNIINDMLQRLAESNPELLNEGYTGSIFDLWADDNTQEENEEDLDEVNELDQDDKAVIAEMMQQHAATSANQDYKPASTATPNPVSLLNRSNTLASKTYRSAREIGYNRLYINHGIPTPLSAGAGEPIDSFPHLARERSATVDAVPHATISRRGTEYRSTRSRDIPLESDNTDLFSVMASTVTGSSGHHNHGEVIRGRARAATEIITINEPPINTTNTTTTTTTADQESAEGAEPSSSRKKTNATATTAKLDDLMKELVCV